MRTRARSLFFQAVGWQDIKVWRKYLDGRKWLEPIRRAQIYAWRYFPKHASISLAHGPTMDCSLTMFLLCSCLLPFGGVGYSMHTKKRPDFSARRSIRRRTQISR